MHLKRINLIETPRISDYIFYLTCILSLRQRSTWRKTTGRRPCCRRRTWSAPPWPRTAPYCKALGTRLDYCHIRSTLLWLKFFELFPDPNKEASLIHFVSSSDIGLRKENLFIAFNECVFINDVTILGEEVNYFMMMVLNPYYEKT